MSKWPIGALVCDRESGDLGIVLENGGGENYYFVHFGGEEPSTVLGDDLKRVPERPGSIMSEHGYYFIRGTTGWLESRYLRERVYSMSMFDLSRIDVLFVPEEEESGYLQALKYVLNRPEFSRRLRNLALDLVELELSDV